MRNARFIRNIAIIAHIDHGKTTLLDALLRQSKIFRDNEVVPERMMDSYDQERERGITIYAKHTSIDYGDYCINIIDTPGHSDFSGEVERVLGMVNSVLLLVDAKEGPMPQTRFVLSKALKMGLNPIVVINKVDRPAADPDRALNLTFDLFVELGATDAQLDFKHCYASGLNGFAMAQMGDPQVDMAPLCDLILTAVPPPEADESLPFCMQVMTTTYNDFVGRQATGRILHGQIRKGQYVQCIGATGNATTHQITKVEGYQGLKRVPFEEGVAGDIVSLSGIPEVIIGDTLCDAKSEMRFPPIALDEPSVSVSMWVNNSPFAGRDGKNIVQQDQRPVVERKARQHFAAHRRIPKRR